MKTRTVMALVCLLLLLSLCSCGTPEPFLEGEALSAYEVEARRAEILAERAENEDTPHNGVYYWIKSGEVYHLYPTCTYVKNATEVSSGSLAEATAAGKVRACAVCGD